MGESASQGRIPLRGRDPEEVVDRIRRERALRVLRVPPEVEGERLV